LPVARHLRDERDGFLLLAIFIITKHIFLSFALSASSHTRENTTAIHFNLLLHHWMPPTDLNMPDPINAGAVFVARKQLNGLG
jgi:hypothetical protein